MILMYKDAQRVNWGEAGVESSDIDKLLPGLMGIFETLKV